MEDLYYLVHDNVYDIILTTKKFQIAHHISISQKSYTEYIRSYTTLTILKTNKDFYHLRKIFTNVKKLSIQGVYQDDFNVSINLSYFANVQRLILKHTVNRQPDTISVLDLTFMTGLTYLYSHIPDSSYYQFNYTSLKKLKGCLQSDSLLLKNCINLESMTIRSFNRKNIGRMNVQYSKLTKLSIIDESNIYQDINITFNFIPEYCENIIHLNLSDVSISDSRIKYFKSLETLTLSNMKQWIQIYDLTKLYMLEIKKECNHIFLGNLPGLTYVSTKNSNILLPDNNLENLSILKVENQSEIVMKSFASTLQSSHPLMTFAKLTCKRLIDSVRIFERCEKLKEIHVCGKIFCSVNEYVSYAKALTGYED